MKENTGQADLMKLIGKAIVLRPMQVKRLLNRHGINVPSTDPTVLTDGVMSALGRMDKRFQAALTGLLTNVDESEDHFIGAIAQAVGAVAGAIGSGQQKKAAREQAKAAREEAKAQTLASILAFKSQQLQNQAQQQARQAQARNQQREQHNRKSQTQMFLLAGGVIVALILVGLFMMQRKQGTVQPVPQVIRTR